jgi:hypothetical protein
MIEDIGYIAILICYSYNYFKLYPVKKTLLVTLVLAFLIEAVLCFLCFFMPAKAMELFGMQYSDQFAFLGYIIAWFLLLVTGLIGYAIYLLQVNIGLGIGVYAIFDKLDNLLLDSLKGMVILGLNYFYNKDGASKD